MNKINPVISKMNIEDIDEIVNLQVNNNNILLSRDSILSDLNNNEIYFVAKTNNFINGYIAAKLQYDHIDILGVLVDHKYTRNGLASCLLTYLLDYAISINIHEVLLEVRVSNLAAQKLYEKFGFIKISIRKQYYEDNLEDALIYKLSI